ncbi:MAG TPA: FmdB family zinc ribbon protein [Bryobacteraceae bacterium]|nr:FmdB family zinc ribbon protein [Bryobacteraceae bacterium]
MPIFEYACESCGNKFEKLVRRTGDGVECPSCTSKALTQQYSTFSAHANGAPAAAQMPQCPAGMCGTPGLCGRN